MSALWALLAVVWFLAGVAGILWWSRIGSRATGPQDISVGDFLACLMWGPAGPLSWIVGWLIFRPSQFFDRIVIRRRTKA